MNSIEASIFMKSSRFLVNSSQVRAFKLNSYPKSSFIVNTSRYLPVVFSSSLMYIHLQFFKDAFILTSNFKRHLSACQI
jgi:hypothetical protein